MKLVAYAVSAVTLSLLAALPAPARATESFDACSGTIAALPAVVGAQGTWCLKQDLNTGISSGNAITITTNNVTIDCNGFKLGGLSAGPSAMTVGIVAANRQNVTVRNCNIRGFLIGMALIGDGHIVEDNRVEGSFGNGIAVSGDNGMIRRNQVLSIGGNTGGASPNGISSDGSIDVIDNTVADVVANSGSGVLAIGIEIAGAGSRSIAGNRIRNIIGDGDGAAASQAIYNVFNATSGASIRDNTLDGGGSAGMGINCWAPELFIVSGNHVQGFVGEGIATACVNGGGNVVLGAD
jgi:hypothetical protein